MSENLKILNSRTSDKYIRSGIVSVSLCVDGYAGAEVMNNMQSAPSNSSAHLPQF